MISLERMIKGLYEQIAALYPKVYKAQFQEEMVAVFSKIAEYDGKRGIAYLVKAILIELLDAPQAILSAYWYVFQENIKGMLLPVVTLGSDDLANDSAERSDQMTSDGNPLLWRKEKRKEAIIASLPPMIFGAGISLSWFVIGSRWFEIPPWQLIAGLFIGLTASVILAIGAILGLIKGLPDWSFTWLGSSAIGFILMVNTFVDEVTETGYEISPLTNTIGNIIVLILLLPVILLGAKHGLTQAGLVSIGMASTLGISLIHAVVIPPISRHELVLLSLILGSITSVLIFFFFIIQSKWRISLMIMIGMLNIGTAAIASYAWKPWFNQKESPSPFPTLIVILTILLLAGPVLGLISKTIQGKIQRI